jgi:hypothetical protein
VRDGMVYRQMIPAVISTSDSLRAVTVLNDKAEK